MLQTHAFKIAMILWLDISVSLLTYFQSKDPLSPLLFLANLGLLSPVSSLQDSSNLKCSPAVSAGRSPKALNGLLNPQLEALKNSQTSLCEMLQEKEKKTWSGGTMGMDHSALIPLRSKNFRERSDAHFVDVIKEDRLEYNIMMES